MNRNYSGKNETVQARVTSETTTTLSLHKHFIKHIVDVLYKQPWELNKKNSSLLIQRLENKNQFPHTITKLQSRSKPLTAANWRHLFWSAAKHIGRSRRKLELGSAWPRHELGSKTGEDEKCWRIKTEPKTKTYSTQAGDQNELQPGREPSPARKITKEKQILGGGKSKKNYGSSCSNQGRDLQEKRGNQERRPERRRKSIWAPRTKPNSRICLTGKATGGEKPNQTADRHGPEKISGKTSPTQRWEKSSGTEKGTCKGQNQILRAAETKIETLIQELNEPRLKTKWRTLHEPTRLSLCQY
jgi:hypothetical protein